MVWLLEPVKVNDYQKLHCQQHVVEYKKDA